MEQQELNELTTLIDNFNYKNNESITVEMLHDRLWTGLNKLRMATNKDNLISEWKYNLNFISTELRHTNKNKSFEKVEWEKSYVLDFWMGIYH